MNNALDLLPILADRVANENFRRIVDWARTVIGQASQSVEDIEASVDDAATETTTLQAAFDALVAALGTLAYLSGDGNAWHILRGDLTWTDLVVENRTSDPSTPVSGQLWLRTDL